MNIPPIRYPVANLVSKEWNPIGESALPSWLTTTESGTTSESFSTSGYYQAVASSNGAIYMLQTGEMTLEEFDLIRFSAIVDYSTATMVCSQSIAFRDSAWSQNRGASVYVSNGATIAQTQVVTGVSGTTLPWTMRGTAEKAHLRHLTLELWPQRKQTAFYEQDQELFRFSKSTGHGTGAVVAALRMVSGDTNTNFFRVYGARLDTARRQ